MSKIQDRIGNRYDKLLAYFKSVPFGSIPADMSTLSDLPPVDRCLILEQVLDSGACDFIACVNKLSMAYYKAGMENMAFFFLERCNDARLLGGWYGSLCSHLDGLIVRNVSSDYERTITKLKYNESVLSKIICEMCIEYKGREVGDYVIQTNQDLGQFVSERENFIMEFTNRAKSRLF